MTDPLVLSLPACEEEALAGGKAVGLARLIQLGFRVPVGVCLTTLAYDTMLRAVGLDVDAIWARLQGASDEVRRPLISEIVTAIRRTTMPTVVEQALIRALDCLEAPLETVWAVRSSATNEDQAGRSFAGQYRTRLGVSRSELGEAIKDCWASLWQSAAINAVLGAPGVKGPPRMAVVVQKMVDAQAAGVVFSAHPMSGRVDRVVIEAVLGLGAPLVSGEVTPNEYVVCAEDTVGAWTIGKRRLAMQGMALRCVSGGVEGQPIPAERAQAPVLDDPRILDLARVSKRVETAFGRPMDIEWAFDGMGYWLLQARPMMSRPLLPTDETSEWSRANFKETMPEVPSPAGLSFLQEYMEANLLRHYRALGCSIPPGLSSVRVIRGRPFINVTLFQWLVAQLGSDPALVTEQMGGQGSVPAQLPPRLSPFRLARAGVIVWWKMRRALRRAPQWFQEMKAMAEVPIAPAGSGERIQTWLGENQRLGQRLAEEDPTFAIAVGVGQGLDVLGRFMSRWFPEDWRMLLNAALQGQGSVISARQILWLADLADLAKSEPVVRAFFRADSWEPARHRDVLAGTRFLAEWDRFLAAYGQRAVGESDVMVPRQAEQPAALLGVVRGYLLSDGPASSPAVVARQAATRADALERIRRRVRRWPGAWSVFRWWYARLGRFLALREANRHHLMYFLVAVRRRLLAIGEALSEQKRLAVSEDVFFLTVQEIRALAQEPMKDWRPVVAARRGERAVNESASVPDFVSPRFADDVWAIEGQDPEGGLRGIPLSPGVVEGPVCVVRSTADLARVRPGAILVLPVIDPGLTPYFGLAAGVVAEMGGTLSHGAIIAREYGIPAVANVVQATSVLRDGEVILLDASRGILRRRVESSHCSTMSQIVQ